MHFEKVSYEQWAKDVPLKNVPWTMLKQWYNDIKLPQQGTICSMGVDFYLPYNVNILPHNLIKIPTGIRWVCDTPDDGHYGMLIVPRSSIGIKHGLMLCNTIGVIDSDYYVSENEGHIQLFFRNVTDEAVSLPQHKGIAQGLIIPYVIPKDASSEDIRIGGFGSTDNN